MFLLFFVFFSLRRELFFIAFEGIRTALHARPNQLGQATFDDSSVAFTLQRPSFISQASNVNPSILLFPLFAAFCVPSPRYGLSQLFSQNESTQPVGACRVPVVPGGLALRQQLAQIQPEP